MELIVDAPFVGAASRIVDIDGSFAALAIIKATFVVGASGQVVLADEPRAINIADEWFGEPGRSSVIHESDGAYEKPRTDIVATGHVIAPDGKPTTECLCHLRVGQVAKTVQVIGDRRWVASWLDTRASPPLSFERMPICWERAFGGFDLAVVPPTEGHWDPRNPVGPGFCSRGTPTVLDGVALPNFELPGAKIVRWRDHPPPQGLGFVGRAWSPRVARAGTYDERWQRARMPVLPEDFDPRFFNGAPDDLQYPGLLVGGELVEAVNLSRRGVDRFELPRFRVEVEGLGYGRLQRRTALLDTAVFTLSEDRFTLAWRAKFGVRHNEPEEPVRAEIHRV